MKNIKDTNAATAAQGSLTHLSSFFSSPLGSFYPPPRDTPRGSGKTCPVSQRPLFFGGVFFSFLFTVFLLGMGAASSLGILASATAGFVAAQKTLKEVSPAVDHTGNILLKTALLKMYAPPFLPLSPASMSGTRLRASVQRRHHVSLC